MGATYANSLLKSDSDVFLLEAGTELSLHVTFSIARDTFVGLTTDTPIASGDSTIGVGLAINDDADDYGADGDEFILSGITPSMAKLATSGGFINQAVLPRFSRGLMGGPRFKTIIQETADGSEYRISRWQRAQRRYDIGSAIDTQQDFRDLLAFYKQVHGGLHGFRMRDPFDWSTHTNHMSNPDITNVAHRQLIGSGDGTSTQFQLVKRYKLGDLTRARPITCPQATGVETVHEIYLDGTIQTSGFNWVFNGGKVEFDSAPAAGVAIEWCGTFEVPVRFDQEIDQGLLANMETDERYTVGLTATELLVAEPFSDHKWMGGVHTETITQDTAIYIGAGRLWRVTASTSGLKLYAPHTKHLLDGGVIVTVKNIGSNSFDIYPYYLSTTKLHTLAANKHIHLVLGSDGKFTGIA